MDLMWLIGVAAILVICVIIAYYLLNQVNLDPTARKIVQIGLVVVVAIVVIWIIAAITGVGHVRVPGP
jgi:cytochrome bd-type quinol oxidase subunit 1